MLHIVQVVLAGSAEPPKVFLDKLKAEAMFVDCAKTYWAQSYAAFCERGSLESNSFAAAQAFVASFDLADRSRVLFWSVTPEDADPGELQSLLPGAAALMAQREQIRQMVHDVEQASATVRDGVSGLLEIVATLTGHSVGEPVQTPTPAVGQDVPGLLTVAPSQPAAEAPKPAVDPEQYTTKEWQDYVESIKNMCGGNRGEFHLFTRADWRDAVYSNRTSFEYWQWVAVTIDEHIEQAQKAGYTVVEDPDAAGRYRFKTPDGVLGEVSCDAQGDAWCRAGLHLEGR